MSAPGSSVDRQHVVQAQIKSLLLLDMVDSTGMIERLGDLKAAEHIRRHDRFVRDLLKVHGGREIDKTDGFLLLFDRPVQAAAFALTYQRGLKDNPELPIRTRVGLHVGEVVLYENAAEDVAAGAKVVELEGLAKPVAARLMSLALPGQILLSDLGQSMIARGFAELQQRFPQVALKDHGGWHLKGVHEVMHVYELGEPGVAPFARPLDVEKVRHDRRRLLLGTAAAAGTGALGLGGWWWWDNRSISIPFEKRDWVVVGDFSNDTGQELLDDALDQAFRVGLEQSQFVNVIPDPQMRDALKRMRRPSDGTLTERGVLCEVALRENARAAVVPHAVNHAGRIRIASELVEPRTQRVVAVDAVDAAGMSSVVGAVDQLVRKLRERFGEQRAEIDQETLPLEQVTSGSLEALRSYSLGLKSFTRGEYDEASVLLQHAIKLDAEFAAAYAKLSGINFVMGQIREAMHNAGQAAALSDRLTPRERLYVDGTLTFDQTPARMLEKWALLARMFPDFKIGQHNCGFVEWQFQNRFPASVEWLQSVAHTRYPQQPVTLNVFGYALLGDERYQQADAVFALAREISASPYAFGRVDSLLAQEQLAEAAALLTEERPTTGLFGYFYDLRQVAALVYRGRLAEAQQRCEMAIRQTTGTGHLARLQLVAVSIVELRGGSDLRQRLQTAVARELEALSRDRLDLDYTPAFQLTLLAQVLARNGQIAAAQELAERIRAETEDSGFFFRERQFALLQAEIALASGHPEQVMASLLPAADTRRLVAEDEIEWRASTAAGGAVDPQLLARLAARRGRALAEWNEGFVQQPYNIWQVMRAQVQRVTMHPEQPEMRALREQLTQRWQDADAGLQPVEQLRSS